MWSQTIVISLYIFFVTFYLVAMTLGTLESLSCVIVPVDYSNKYALVIAGEIDEM